MSAKDVFSAALNNEELPETEDVSVVETPEVEAAPAVEAEAETPAEKVAEVPEPQAKEHNVPSWRVKEEADRRREAEERAAKFERENREYQRRLEALEKAKQPEEPQEFDWQKPEGYVQRAVETVEQKLERMIRQNNETSSLRWASKEHGQEKVLEARTAFDAAVNGRDPQAIYAYQQAMQSDDPYGVILDWHRQSTTLKEIGGDLNGYRQRTLDEALKDPAFLQKALEAARTQATPAYVSTGQKPSTSKNLPSLARQTAAAGNDDEPDDPVEVFTSALRHKR